MQCIRQGTRKKIEQALRRHAELMAGYIAEGMSREEASKKAFADVTGKPAPDFSKKNGEPA